MHRGVNRMACPPIGPARTRRVAQVCCGVVRNVRVPALRGAMFKLSLAPLEAAVERSARRVRLDKYSCRALELM